MHFYTSVNVNYLAKARVLAASVKKHCKDSFFSLVLYDTPPEGFDLADEPFDELVMIDDLHLPVNNLKLWLYLHNVVELGTAIKGQALVNFLKRSPKVAYLDPDIVVYHDLSELEKLLDQYAVVLTPHQLAPDEFETAIVGNEIGSLLRGTFNFGFYAANNTENGMRFATWFRDRLLEYCFDDVGGGLFTDQRWGNLVPAMFDDVCIWRNPGCNVSTWNLTHRKITKDEKGSYLVNGTPLLFYHYSGFDSGAQLEMVKLFGGGNPLLIEMRDWYIIQQDQAGQQTLFKRPFQYNFYSDGTKIPQEHRTTLRNRKDVQAYLGAADPFDKKATPSYYEWYVGEEKLRGKPSFEKHAKRKLLGMAKSALRRVKGGLTRCVGLGKRAARKIVHVIRPNRKGGHAA